MEPFPLPTVVPTSRGPVELADWGEGPAVLAIHGAMGGHDQGVLLARTVGEGGYRYLAPSRPGYLGTPLSAGKSAEDQADLYAEVLERLGIRSAAVMAVSGGGPSALLFAARHPALCWGLVLVSTCSGIILEKLPLAFHLMKLLVRLPGFAASLRRRTERHCEKAAARSIRDPAVLARTLGEAEAGSLMKALMLSTADRMARRLPGTENDVRITRTTTYPLERILAPTLVVHGTADRVVSFDHARTLVARIPGARLLTVEGGEHVAIFTDRDRVRAAVTAFLREHAPAKGQSGTGT
ncbi:MAG TPA: alpha/beta hydrolase [Anaeromyxobacter sp.]|nr:alpha/beta hydrolase [Anaeromyxobacter sp.]